MTSALIAMIAAQARDQGTVADAGLWPGYQADPHSLVGFRSQSGGQFG